jgi:hypothetical protein
MSILQNHQVGRVRVTDIHHLLDLQIFLCGGRLILGPDAASLLITVILIVGPTVIFNYQMKSKFYHSQEHVTWQHHMHRAAALIVILTTIMVGIQDGATTCHCIFFNERLFCHLYDLPKQPSWTPQRFQPEYLKL